MKKLHLLKPDPYKHLFLLESVYYYFHVIRTLIDVTSCHQLI